MLTIETRNSSINIKKRYAKGEIYLMKNNIVNNNPSVKVLSIQASDIFKIANGQNIDGKYDPEFNTVLPFSLLSAKLGRLSVIRKGQTTSKDIIGVNFDFGYTTDRLRKLESIVNRFKNRKKKLNKNKTMDATLKGNKQLYIKVRKEYFEDLAKAEKTKWNADNLRTMLYNNGFNLPYTHKVKGEEITDIIHYVFWFRTPAKSRVGDVIFINKDILNTINAWQNMGLTLPLGETKVVEFEAYRSLTASSIERTIEINPKHILVLNDLDSYMDIKVASVETKAYKNDTNTVNIATVVNKMGKVKNTLFDGQCLLDSSYFEVGDCFYLLRQHMFKSCAFNTEVVSFLKDYCKENGLDYNTAQTQDKYGNNIRICNIRFICTENSCKFEKFSNCGCIGKDGIEITNKKQMFGYWKQRVKEDKYLFGICKRNHSSKYGTKQRTSYQHVNSLLINPDEVKELAQYTIDYINLLKNDEEKFLEWLKDTATTGNNNNVYLDLYYRNLQFRNTDMFKKFKSKSISGLKKRAKQGKLLVEGDNLTCAGNPYLMLLHAVGEVTHVDNVITEGFTDPTLPALDNSISCYTQRFDNGMLAGFRNPHNAPNNCILMQNFKDNDLMDRYFNLGSNVIAVNCVHTEIQSAANGMDFDSDFMLCTNEAIAVQAVEKVFRSKDYFCIINDIAPSDKVWTNDKDSISSIDNLLAKGKLDIGQTSNLAQLALSFYQNCLFIAENIEYAKSKDNQQHAEDKKEILKFAEELKTIFIISSVLAQISIDTAKRQYSIDIPTTIKAIKKTEAFKQINKLKPKWMDIISSTNISKGKLCTCSCTMGYLQDVIEEGVINLINNKENLPTELLLKEDIILNNYTNYPQIKEIQKIIESYDKQVKYLNQQKKKYKWNSEKLEKKVNPIRDNVISKIGRLTINKETMYYLVKNAITNTTDDKKLSNEEKSDLKKVKTKMLNILYNTHTNLFLSVWK